MATPRPRAKRKRPPALPDLNDLGRHHLDRAAGRLRLDQQLADIAASAADASGEEPPPSRQLVRMLDRHERDSRRLLGRDIGLTPRIAPDPQLAQIRPFNEEGVQAGFLGGGAGAGGAFNNGEIMPGADTGVPATAWGRAGTASLSPTYHENLGQIDIVILGWSVVVPMPNRPCDVRFTSTVQITPTWLEALSLGKASYGRVETTVDLTMYSFEGDGPIATSYHAPEERIEAMCGEAPRGNYREGEIGVWHPSPPTQVLTQTVTGRFEADVSPHVSVTQMVFLRAERIHRRDRCNAVIAARATWNKGYYMINYG